MAIDLTGGIDPAREYMFAERPADPEMRDSVSFWVFDDRLVLWNHFTGEGEVSPDGRELDDDPGTVKTCAAAFDAAWELAVPHGEYTPA